jgi:16S rRNA (uracil1498-N3)-methyltransferase
MECFIVDPKDVFPGEGYLLLRNDEAHHAIKSLRIRTGESLFVTTLDGICYRTILNSIEEGKKEIVARCTIELEFPEFNEPSLKVELVQAVLSQQSKLEEIVERCTEIGISSFTPISTARTERSQIKHERIERILRSACKQSSRARKPVFSELTSLEEALKRSRDSGREIIVLHEAAPKENSLRNVLQEIDSKIITIAIGPEGGFTQDEVDMCSDRFEACIASLGARRLRAETAAITASAIALSFDRSSFDY